MGGWLGAGRAGNTNANALAAPDESTQEDATVSAIDAIEITERDRLLAAANAGLPEGDTRRKILISPGENSLVLQSNRCVLMPLAVIGSGIWTDAFDRWHGGAATDARVRRLRRRQGISCGGLYQGIFVGSNRRRRHTNSE